MEICEAENLKYTEKGIDAAFALCEGDMRRVVNMLQVKIKYFNMFNNLYKIKKVTQLVEKLNIRCLKSRSNY